MNKYKQFESIVDLFQKRIELWKKEYPDLSDAVENLNRKQQKKSVYKIDNAMVFNRNLRKIGTKGPKYILVADNPGMDEQKNENCCYLIGKSGKMARNFFVENKLVSDFDSEVAVLNKSCVHTHSTTDLKKLNEFNELVADSQEFMADIAIDIQKIYGCKLWIIGCSELHEKGIFAPYLRRLSERYQTDACHIKENVSFYPHFSYGNFQKNLNIVKAQYPEMSFEKTLEKAGKSNSQFSSLSDN